jgi:hypothetical protein
MQYLNILLENRRIYAFRDHLFSRRSCPCFNLAGAGSGRNPDIVLVDYLSPLSRYIFIPAEAGVRMII